MRLGIFVGGRSTRMGGSPKGRLPTSSGEPIVVRLVRVGREAGLDVVLVGDAAPYRELLPDVPALPDDPEGTGPLGGLSALVRSMPSGHAIAVACDMPFVTSAVLERLASHPSSATILAPRRSLDGPFEPLLARYAIGTVRPALDRALADGLRSFQSFFSRVDVEPLAIDAELEAALVDWDSPDDVSRGAKRT